MDHISKSTGMEITDQRNNQKFENSCRSLMGILVLQAPVSEYHIQVVFKSFLNLERLSHYVAFCLSIVHVDRTVFQYLALGTGCICSDYAKLQNTNEDIMDRMRRHHHSNVQT